MVNKNVKTWKSRMRRRERALTRPQKKVVRKIVDSKLETNKKTVEWNATNIDNNGSTSDVVLNSVAEGDGPDERDGSTITMKSLWTRLNIYRGDSTYNVVRLILYSPKNSQAQYMTNDYPTIHSPLDYDKYKIWADKQVLLDADQHVAKIQFRHNLRNMKARWSDSAGSTFLQGNLKMILVSDSTTSPHPTASGYTTVTFKDG